MPDDKPLLHASQMNMFFRCGIQFQRTYGQKFGVWHKQERIPPGFALAVGSATHQSIDKNMSYKLKNGILLPVDGVVQVAVEAATKILSGDLHLTADERKDFEALKGKAIDMAAALSKLHHVQLAPKINPIEVEWEWVMNIKNYPIGMAGTIDLIELITSATEYRPTVDADEGLRDTKTIARTPQPSAIYTIQNGIYVKAMEAVREKRPKRIGNDYLVKTRQPKAVSHEGEIKEPWLDATMARVKRMIETIDAVKAGHEAFSPARPDDWVCSPRFCGFYETCKFKSCME